MKVIDVEDTPNPDALKFLVDGTLVETGVRQFDSRAAAGSDPLANALFAIPGVLSVFYMSHSVTISKVPEVRWSSIQPKINETIAANAPVLVGASTNGGGASAVTDDDDLLQKINKVLNENIRPALEGDGGGVEILGLDGYVLTIHYQGACGSCPSSTAGTMYAVQNLLQRMVDPRLMVVSG